jgi:hypothetical protein
VPALGQRRRIVAGGVVAAGILSSTLSGCTTSSTPGGATAALPSAPANIVISANDLQGNWGLASYRKVEDRPRTEAEAKTACQNPYVVTAGANGGVLMYLADQTGAAGVPQDRVVLSYENNVLVADWLNASARERYGTMVFVKCNVA